MTDLPSRVDLDENKENGILRIRCAPMCGDGDYLIELGVDVSGGEDVLRVDFRIVAAKPGFFPLLHFGGPSGGGGGGRTDADKITFLPVVGVGAVPGIVAAEAGFKAIFIVTGNGVKSVTVWVIDGIGSLLDFVIRPISETECRSIAVDDFPFAVAIFPFYGPDALGVRADCYLVASQVDASNF